VTGAVKKSRGILVKSNGIISAPDRALLHSAAKAEILMAMLGLRIIQE